MNREPSNAELKESFDRHAADDKIFQDAQAAVNTETVKSLQALHKRVGELATKKDIANVEEFLKGVQVGVGIFKFSWNNASKIGSFVLMLIAIFAIAKFGIMGAIQWFFSKVL